MQRLRTIFFNITFALNCLLLFLLLFEQMLVVPAWLQVVGRMHPLLLHFPIVLLVLAVVWELFTGFKKPDDPAKAELGDGLLLSAAFLAVLTSLMGLFLSREEGYEADMLWWHKWSGVLISLISLAWYTFRVRMRRVKAALVLTSLFSLVAIVITGHEGANITHGQNFLLAPVLATASLPPVTLEEAAVYTHVVRPILENKCMNCHNTQKAKGGLNMETEELLLKGGKNGFLWDSTEKDGGLLLRRLHLPLQDKKHMPPQGKPQLTDEEVEIIQLWIRSGASFTTRLVELPQNDSLRMLAEPRFQTVVADDFTFAAADESKIKKYNNNYRVVQPLALGSPALTVTFFSASQFHPAQLKELLDLKEQVVSLNVNKMPLVDEDLKTIAQFTNLLHLNLSFTNISGAALAEIEKLKNLKSLSLSGTAVQAAHLRPLANLPRLQQLYLWNTGVQGGEMASVEQQLKGVSVESGFKGDTITIALNAPLIENEEQVMIQPVPLQLKHYINGVTIRYTTDGSEPDSLRSPVYKEGVLIDKSMTVKAKAFKPGWISSNVAERSFFKAGFQPDSVQLIHAPSPQYKGDGGATLADQQKGDQNFRSGKWLGYKGEPMEALFYLNKPATISSITVSNLVDIGAYIMPPQQVEVWGGQQAGNLKLLKQFAPQQPAKQRPGFMTSYELRFAPAEVKVLKVVVKPVMQLPSWHQGKGEKAWIFVDEVFIN